MLLYLVYCILGGTNTAEGIRWAQDIVSFSDRAHVQKFIILLTNDESITNSAAAAATSAKNDGIYIIVVGKRLHGGLFKKNCSDRLKFADLIPLPVVVRFYPCFSVMCDGWRWFRGRFFGISDKSCKIFVSELYQIMPCIMFADN